MRNVKKVVEKSTFSRNLLRIAKKKKVSN